MDPASPKKAPMSPEKKIRKLKAPATHPPTDIMVNEAITDIALKERGGSSLFAIKKYIAANYKVNVDRLSPFIKKYIKAAVADGRLTQKKGTGASGSFGSGSLFRQVAIPTGRYSDRSLFRQVDIPTNRSLFRQVVFPTGRYSDKQVVIPTGRYSDRSIIRQVVIPTGR